MVSDELLQSQKMAEEAEKKPNEPPKYFMLSPIGPDGKPDTTKSMCVSFTDRDGNPSMVPLDKEKENKTLGLSSDRNYLIISIPKFEPMKLIERFKTKSGEIVEKHRELRDKEVETVMDRMETYSIKKEMMKENAIEDFKKRKQAVYDYFLSKENANSVRNRIASYVTKKMEPFVRTKETLTAMFTAAKSVWAKQQEAYRLKDEQRAKEAEAEKKPEEKKLTAEQEERLAKIFSKTCEELGNNLVVDGSSGRFRTYAQLDDKTVYHFNLGDRANNVYENLQQCANALTALQCPDIYPEYHQENMKPVLPMRGRTVPPVVLHIRRRRGIKQTQAIISDLLNTDTFKNADLSNPKDFGLLMGKTAAKMKRVYEEELEKEGKKKAVPEIKKPGMEMV